MAARQNDLQYVDRYRKQHIPDPSETFTFRSVNHKDIS